MRKISKLRLALLLGLATFLYGGIYILLSMNGKYSSRLFMSGQHAYTTGMHMPDICVWEPKYIVCYPPGPNPKLKNILGWAYLPLVQLDRAYWHGSIDVIETNPDLKNLVTQPYPI